jgi:hypothetical protein
MNERERTERQLIKRAYNQGRKDLAKDVINKLQCFREHSALDYVGVGVIDALKNEITKMVGGSDDNR